jgi:DNA-binding LytR/AlgR family response regulator
MLSKEYMKWVAKAIIAMAALFILLALYSGLDILQAIFCSITYTTTITLLANTYSTFVKYIKTTQASLIIATAVQIISCAILYATATLTYITTIDECLKILPMVFIYGTLLWIIFSVQIKKEGESQKENQQQHDHNNPKRPVNEPDGTTSQVSVKEGSQIHIVETDNIQYIQSYGDYVYIFSDGQKFLKEATMKTLEATLPSQFIRVHRSFIVNSSMIARIEQYGKESYHLHLKKGTCIKASASGYKTLKQYLSI